MSHLNRAMGATKAIACDLENLTDHLVALRKDNKRLREQLKESRRTIWSADYEKRIKQLEEMKGTADLTVKSINMEAEGLHKANDKLREQVKELKGVIKAQTLHRLEAVSAEIETKWAAIKIRDDKIKQLEARPPVSSGAEKPDAPSASDARELLALIDEAKRHVDDKRKSKIDYAKEMSRDRYMYGYADAQDLFEKKFERLIRERDVAAPAPKAEPFDARKLLVEFFARNSSYTRRRVEEIVDAFLKEHPLPELKPVLSSGERSRTSEAEGPTYDYMLEQIIGEARLAYNNQMGKGFFSSASRFMDDLRGKLKALEVPEPTRGFSLEQICDVLTKRLSYWALGNCMDDFKALKFPEPPDECTTCATVEELSKQRNALRASEKRLLQDKNTLDIREFLVQYKIWLRPASQKKYLHDEDFDADSMTPGGCADRFLKENPILPVKADIPERPNKTPIKKKGESDQGLENNLDSQLR